MNIDQSTIYKGLALFGLIATVLLLVSFQFLFAIIVLIVAITSWIFSQKNTST